MARAASRTARRSRKGNVITVNFKGVEGRRAAVPEGEWLVKVEEVTQEEGDKAPYLKWVLKTEDDGTLYHNTSLSEKSLWNLKSWLEALGVDVPDDEMDLDLTDYVDRELMVTVEHETYEGKKQARIVDFFAEDGDGGKDKDRGRDRDDDRGRGRDRDDDRGSRRNRDRDRDSDRGERGSRDRDRGSSRGRGRDKEPDLLDQEDIKEMGQEELEDVIKDNKLDVDLDEYKTLTKMRNAVIDAAEKEKLLKD